MLASLPLPALIAIGIALVAHFPLLTFALYKLFLLRPNKVVSIACNVLLVLFVIVGPAAFLIWYYATGKETAVRAALSALGRKEEVAAPDVGAGKEVPQASDGAGMAEDAPPRDDTKVPKEGQDGEKTGE